MNRMKNKNCDEIYFLDPVQNAAFISCVDILSEMIEKYVDKVMDSIEDDIRSEKRIDYIITCEGFSVLCEIEETNCLDILKAYAQKIEKNIRIDKFESA